MPPTRSPEIESVARRVLVAWKDNDMAVMANLMSADPNLRVIGFAQDEWWAGPEEFLTIRETQGGEIPEYDIEFEKVDAFEDGEFGWAAISSRIVTSGTKTPLRHIGVFRLEVAIWKVILWHNSVAVPNSQVFGIELT